MTPRPVIGISSYVEPARFGVWDTTVTLIPHNYVEQIARAGGQPVVLPPIGEPAELVDRLDGLILSGGGDIDPSQYEAAPHPATGYIREFRDTAELGLLRAALAARLPFLGICRGLQVLNVVRGGSLHQHLPDVVGHRDHAPAPGVFGRLPVRLTPGGRLARLLGPTVDAAHYHHQAIDRLGTGLTPIANADDGTIEAVDIDDHPFALAVQWHPETDEGNELFAALVCWALQWAHR